MIAGAALALLVIAFLIAKLPVAQCEHCAHCQEKKRLEEEEQQRLRDRMNDRWRF